MFPGNLLSCDCQRGKPVLALRAFTPYGDTCYSITSLCDETQAFSDYDPFGGASERYDLHYLQNGGHSLARWPLRSHWYYRYSARIVKFEIEQYRISENKTEQANSMGEATGDDRWIDVDEASRYLSVSRATLYNYMRDGRLPYYYLAGTRHRRVRKRDLDALLELGKPGDVDEAEDNDPADTKA